MSTAIDSSDTSVPSPATQIVDSTKPRAAIVTGASRGIGRAIAIQLAEDGFDVGLNSLPRSIDQLKDLVQTIERKGRKAIIVSGDVSNEEVVQELVDRTVSELGELYVMVANAGISPPSISSIANTSFSDWKRVIEVNLNGVFLCYRAAARQMLKQGKGGRIIGGSSVASKQGFPLWGPYCPSKFGVNGVTQVLGDLCLATELAPSNITVNTYAAGFINTDIAKGYGEGEGEGNALSDKYVKMAPIKRYGTVEEVAGLVSYLVSDKASFMTGQSVSINGGSYYD